MNLLLRKKYFLSLYLFLTLLLISLILLKLINKDTDRIKLNHFKCYDCINDKHIIFTIDKNPTLVLLFNSECSHCENQINNILKNIDLFKNIKLVFISCEEVSEIKKISEKFKLYSNEKIILLNADYKLVTSTFHFKTYPTIFLFKNQMVYKIIDNQIDVKKIQRYLK